jgi:hypothetical protein
MAKILHRGLCSEEMCHLMTQYFQAYVSNLNRVRLIELIERQETLLRLARARASLIFNPLSGRPYVAAEGLPQAKPASSSR